MIFLFCESWKYAPLSILQFRSENEGSKHTYFYVYFECIFFTKTEFWNFPKGGNQVTPSYDFRIALSPEMEALRACGLWILSIEAL